MAHNRSPSKIRADVLGSDLAIYRGWQLEKECGGSGCPAGRSLRVDVLAQRWPGLSVSDVLLRLRCQGCGRGPETVTLAEMRGAGRRVALRGEACRY